MAKLLILLTYMSNQDDNIANQGIFVTQNTA